MNELNSESLIFQTASGEQVACSAEWVTLELVGEKASLPPELIRNTVAAVLHYFKHELKRSFVRVTEFVIALEKALRSVGMSLSEANLPEPRVAESDLRVLAAQAGKGCELFFFSSLREEVRRNLGREPQILRFNGLRGCVKQLAGAQRWSNRCEGLSEQIVEFLRGCWRVESGSQNCALVVW